MKKLLAAGLMMVALSGPVAAQTVEDLFVSGLQDQGYKVLEKGYTFLGRLRIVAEDDTYYREIVVNPGTGEILRDYAVLLTNKRLARDREQMALDSSSSSTSGTTVIDSATATSVIADADTPVDDTTALGVTAGVTKADSTKAEGFELRDPIVDPTLGGN